MPNWRHPNVESSARQQSLKAHSNRKFREHQGRRLWLLLRVHLVELLVGEGNVSAKIETKGKNDTDRLTIYYLLCICIWIM